MNLSNTMIRIRTSLKRRIKYFCAFETCKISVDKAHSILSGFSSMPGSSSVTVNHISNCYVDLLIIIPAYNAEEWIEECLNSILSQQTDYSFLIRVVDDGSTDNTGLLIDRYIFDKRVEVIHQENRGYSGARNRALEDICSEYIMFVDADDYILPGAIETLMNAAKQEDADIVEGNGYKFNTTGRLGKIKTRYTDCWGTPWMKVIRSYLFEKVQFPQDYLYEDTIISCLIYPRAKKVLTIENEVYAYRIHSNSITQMNAGPKSIDSYWIMVLMERDQEKLSIRRDYEMYLRVMLHIVLTFHRTQSLPEEIRKAIFIATKDFLTTYYSDFLDSKDRYKPLAKAIKESKYGKYKLYCQDYTF